MATTHQDLLAAVETVMAGWTATDVWGPNERFDLPSRSADPTAPAAYVAWELRLRSRERITFGGTVEIRAAVAHGIWIEKDAEDHKLYELLDTLLALWVSASIAGVQVLDGDEELGEPATLGEWRGLELEVPLVQFEEPS